MGFYDQFELLELVRDDGIKTFSARELATGRLVDVHVFVNPQAPLSMLVLSKLKHIEGPERANILERGDYEGTPYVVTASLEGFPGFREWVKEASRRAPQEPPAGLGVEAGGAPAAEAVPASLSEPPVVAPVFLAEAPLAADPAAAAQLSPTLSPPTYPAVAATKPSLPAPAAGRDLEAEFARLFEVDAPPETSLKPPAEPTASTGVREDMGPQPPPAAPPVAKEPGEFTRMLQSLGVPEPSQSMPAPVTAPGAGPARTMPVPAASSPGPAEVSPANPSQANPPKPKPAFTSLAIPPQTTPDARVNPPSVLNRTIQTIRIPTAAAAPPPAPSSPAVSPPAPPSNPSPGEFTRAIVTATAQLGAAPPPVPQSPTAAPPALPVPSSQPGNQPVGEFTRAIQTAMPLAEPGPSPWARTTDPGPGEFTRMLQSPLGRAPAGSQSSGVQSGPPQGEFTRMWQSQPTGGAPPVGGPPGSGMGGPGGTPVPEKAGAVDLNRYLQMPVGPMPQSPAVQNMQPQAPSGPGGKPMGEYTQVFGSSSMGPGGLPQAAPTGPPSGAQPAGGATNAFAAPQAPVYPPAPAAGYAGYNPYDPYNLYGAPKPKSEYTQQIAAAAPLTLGQPAPEPPKAPPYGGAAPSPYGAPAPPNPYGAPAAPAYGSPASSYGAPAPPSPYGAPAPPNPYGTPAAPAYGTPPSPYGAPAPPSPYGAPAQPSPYGAAAPSPYGGVGPTGYGAPLAAPPVGAPRGAAPPPASASGLKTKLPLIAGGVGLLIVVVLLILLLVSKK